MCGERFLVDSEQARTFAQQEDADATDLSETLIQSHGSFQRPSRNRCHDDGGCNILTADIAIIFERGAMWLSTCTKRSLQPGPWIQTKTRLKQLIFSLQLLIFEYIEL